MNKSKAEALHAKINAKVIETINHRNVKQCKKMASVDNIKFTVVFNIPVDINTNEYIVKLIDAAARIANTGLDVWTTKFQLPPSMMPK